jgi:hypothetical protein
MMHCNLLCNLQDTGRKRRDIAFAVGVGAELVSEISLVVP